MSQLFLTVLNMSLTAGYVILFLLPLRLILKKSPKIISYALWSVAAFRLVVPFSFQSVYSLLPKKGSARPIPTDIVFQPSPRITSGIEVIDSFVSRSLPVPPAGASINPLQIWTEVAGYVWLIGIAAMLSYALVSVFLLKRQLRSARRIGTNLYEAPTLETPFVLGLIRPGIYLPAGLNAEEKRLVLLHEKTHIQRKDHVVKILSFLILALHWFNPLVWAAFVLMASDMEQSCDERVLKDLAEDVKRPYASLLLSLASDRRIMNGSPLAFGEGNVKERIRNVLRYRRPSFWLATVSMLAVLVVGCSLAADPQQKPPVQPGGSLPVSSSGAQAGSGPDTSPRRTAPDAPAGTAISTAPAIRRVSYDTIRIEQIGGNQGFGQTTEFETSDPVFVASVASSVENSQTAAKTESVYPVSWQYRVILSGDSGSPAYLLSGGWDSPPLIEKDGMLYETDPGFVRYMDSVLENGTADFKVDPAAVKLFGQYGWTLDYRISTVKDRMGDLTALSDFDPSPYYFAYNNELSKDIGLDMSGYSGSIEADIYRLHEPMPAPFGEAVEARGIVVRSGKKIIGAYISAGRHTAFNACSLKGKSFEQSAGKSYSEWLKENVRASKRDLSLAQLAPEDVLRSYITALERDDFTAAAACLSREWRLEWLTSNMLNRKLYQEAPGLAMMNAEGLETSELIQKTQQQTMLRVILRFPKGTEEGDTQMWDCYLVYESPQTGWKIREFGH